MRFLLLLLSFILWASVEGLAHCPRLVQGPLTTVTDPEKSQAFYGELSGTSHRFIIQSNSAFRLFLQLMEPDVPSSQKVFGLTLCKKEGAACRELWKGNKEVSWTSFYEEFVGDHYWVGPTFSDTLNNIEAAMRGVMVPAGTYLVDVFSPSNSGKYILGVGDVEEWSMSEVVNAVVLLPSIKQFFEKPWWKYFTTPTTIVMAAIFLILLIGIVTGLYRLLR